MKSMKILHTFSYSIRKACIAERFNQTIQGKVARELAGRGGGGGWIDVLKSCLWKYNYKSWHSTIKMTPWQAEWSPVKLKKIYDVKYSKIKYKPPKFKVGDVVRLFVDKGKFGRFYQQDYTNELFIVYKVFSNMPHSRYQLKDLNGQLILGNALDEELVLYTPQQQQQQQQQQQYRHHRRDKFLQIE